MSFGGCRVDYVIGSLGLSAGCATSDRAVNGRSDKVTSCRRVCDAWERREVAIWQERWLGPCPVLSAPGGT